jgi:hypothetical protein
VVEAPAQLSVGRLTGTDELPQDLQLSARMERTFLDRCRRLCTDAQTLMLLAAADDSLRLADLRRAGRVLGVAEGALAEVEPSGLLRVDGDLVRVRHERAAHLSVRDDVRARWLFTAAATAYAAGRTERADALLKVARPATGCCVPRSTGSAVGSRWPPGPRSTRTASS